MRTGVAKIEKMGNNKCWWGVEKLETSEVIDEIVKWYSYFGQHFSVSSKS